MIGTWFWRHLAVIFGLEEVICVRLCLENKNICISILVVVCFICIVMEVPEQILLKDGYGNTVRG